MSREERSRDIVTGQTGSVSHSHHHHSRTPIRWKPPKWSDMRAASGATRAVWVGVIVAALATIVGLFALWPSSTPGGDGNAAILARDPIEAHVVRTTTGPCTGTTESDGVQCVFAELEVAGFDAPVGPKGGGATDDVPTLESGVTPNGTNLEAGDDIYVEATTLIDGTVVYSFYDYQRSGPLQVLLLVFVVSVLLLGRRRGFGALAGLAASVLVLVTFLLPSILDGHSPVLVAVVGSAVIAFIALYFAHGVSTATSVALIGTFASLTLITALSATFVTVGKLTGLTDDSAFFLSALGGQIDMRGILLAGFVIGALGVLDDVTVTQVSAVAELRAAQPAATTSQVYRAAMNIGRDHISSTVNTLFLAYAGAALPLLLLFTQTGQSTSSLAGREVIATEIIRSLVGSIGLVAAVPITTWLAVRTLHANGTSSQDATVSETVTTDELSPQH